MIIKIKSQLSVIIKYGIQAAQNYSVNKYRFPDSIIEQNW